MYHKNHGKCKLKDLIPADTKTSLNIQPNITRYKQIIIFSKLVQFEILNHASICKKFKSDISKYFYNFYWVTTYIYFQYHRIFMHHAIWILLKEQTVFIGDKGSFLYKANCSGQMQVFSCNAPHTHAANKKENWKCIYCRITCIQLMKL